VEPLADWAVYLVPPADHALYRVCSTILGWDCRQQLQVERLALPGIPPEILKTWVGPAALYGTHATLSGWMRVPNEHRARIVDELGAVARTFGPIQLDGGRFPAPGDFWYPTTAPIPILVAVFDEPLGALRALHAEVLARFNTLAVSSSYDSGAELPRYTPRHRFYIRRYHEPRVLDEFQFHVSFATALPGPDAVDRLRRAIVDTTGLFSVREHCTWTANEMWLFEQRPDGYWRLAESFPFSA
jgi:hypothetical protein